ncbi:MAG: glycosyltransferase [Cyanobacteria bacterium J06560_6]
MVWVVQNIHFPVSARSFVAPLVKQLNAAHIDTELWVEDNPAHQKTLQALDVPKRLIGSDLSLNVFKFVQKVGKYRQALRQAQPQVLHAHQTRASVIPLLAAYLEKVPVRIYHNHGLPYLGYKGPMRWVLRSLESLNMALATHILLVSHSNLKEAIADNLLPAGKGTVIKSGSAVGIDLKEYDLNKFDLAAARQARKQFGLAEDAFVLGYVGRPVKRKGFHLLIQAWQTSGVAQQGGMLLIAGCSDSECQAVMGHAVPGVKGLGYLDGLTTFYAACDAVTLPSEHEGFPYSMLEGAAAGKPLIGTNIPGIRCTIRHNETGLLVPKDDRAALCNAIRLIAKDKALRSRFGKNARARVEAEFSRDIVLSGLLTFYNGIDRDIGTSAATNK